MSDIVYQILSHIEAHPKPVTFADILNELHPMSAYSQTDAVLSSLHQSGLLISSNPDYQLGHYTLANKTRLLLIQEHQRRQDIIDRIQQDQQKAQSEVIRERRRRKSERRSDQHFQTQLALRSAMYVFLANVASALILEGIRFLLGKFW